MTDLQIEEIELTNLIRSAMDRLETVQRKISRITRKEIKKLEK